MSQATNGVHRCPSCDELADAEYGEDGSVTCLKCGHTVQRSLPPARRRRSQVSRVASGSLVQRDVVSRRTPMEDLPKAKSKLPDPKPNAGSLDARNEEPSYSSEELVEEDSEKKTVRRRKRRRGVKLSRVIFISLWFLCIVFTLWVVRKQKQDSKTVLPKEEFERIEVDELEEQRKAEASGYVKKSIPECVDALKGFLDAPDAAARAQDVRLGKELAAKMATHYGQNTAFKTEERWYLHEDRNLVLRNNLRAIESVMTFGEKGEREVVFVRENNRWKIDWEFFVKHSTSPWHLFLSEVGPTTGTFRVFARLRDSIQTEEAEKVLKLRFYPPFKDQTKRNRSSSPAVLVPEASESGRRILEIIEEKSKNHLTGERTFHKDDPEDLYRVRVVLEWREGTDGKRYLHLNEVQAGNWLGQGFEEFSNSSEVSATTP